MHTQPLSVCGEKFQPWLRAPLPPKYRTGVDRMRCRRPKPGGWGLLLLAWLRWSGLTWSSLGHNGLKEPFYRTRSQLNSPLSLLLRQKAKTRHGLELHWLGPGIGASRCE